MAIHFLALAYMNVLIFNFENYALAYTYKIYTLAFINTHVLASPHRWICVFMVT